MKYIAPLLFALLIGGMSFYFSPADEKLKRTLILTPFAFLVAMKKPRIEWDNH